MKIIKPPEKYNPDTEDGISIFLAGTIEMGTAEDWQAKIEKRFEEYDHVTFLNPRRDDWDITQEQSINNSYFREQVIWEMNNLSAASYIFMYFDPKSISPISLLELGAYAEPGKMTVCCPDGYFRKGNVEIFCDYNNIRLDDTLSEALDNLEQIIKVYKI